jgi:hypothetical protein
MPVNGRLADAGDPATPRRNRGRTNAGKNVLKEGPC